jgi:hypothetical protein
MSALHGSESPSTATSPEKDAIAEFGHRKSIFAAKEDGSVMECPGMEESIQPHRLYDLQKEAI